MKHKCELCELHTIIKLHEDSDPRFIILDCMDCIVPMVVYKAYHTMDICPRDETDMEVALQRVADKVFGRGHYFIDKQQGKIFDHLHWHARPIEEKMGKRNIESILI
tara:strand:+ start:546 stop:866 length:321 start_codon:yes stop_codon:yes gene_type:complete